MAYKLEKEQGQPGISFFLSCKGDLRQNNLPKKRTPPSIEKKLNKKK